VRVAGDHISQAGAVACVLRPLAGLAGSSRVMAGRRRHHERRPRGDLRESVAGGSAAGFLVPWGHGRRVRTGTGGADACTPAVGGGVGRPAGSSTVDVGPADICRICTLVGRIPALYPRELAQVDRLLPVPVHPSAQVLQLLLAGGVHGVKSRVPGHDRRSPCRRELLGSQRAARFQPVDAGARLSLRKLSRRSNAHDPFPIAAATTVDG
jgi:hypothetical protein